MKKVYTIERIAEKLGVNFYDLHPLLTAREDYLIQQAKAEERKKVLDDIQAGAVSVADLIEAARRKTARDIGEGLCILIGNVMLEDKEAGTILGNQLNEFVQFQIKHKYLKGGK